MPLEAWLPLGFALPDGACTRLPLQTGECWQIVDVGAERRTLIVRAELAERWTQSKLIDRAAWQKFEFAGATFNALASPSGQMLSMVSDSRSPLNPNEALAFAVSMRETRAIDGTTPLHDAIYVERLTRLLPTYSLSAPIADDVVLGRWLTGGAQVSVHAHRRMHSLMTWLSSAQLAAVVKQAGLKPSSPTDTDDSHAIQQKGPFSLPGRPALERFFREHVIDIIENADRYRRLGIQFPGAVILHGPPGCGKTFAVERLVEYLAWPALTVEATTIASPYIHETSRKIAEIFDRAIKEAPAVIVIDEMEAFLSDRESAGDSGHHRVEEVGEFLRRIPEAVASRVLVIGMTNRMEMIDPAIMRRGRFDHVVHVDMPGREDVEALLRQILSAIPSDSIDYGVLADQLVGRPLSDIDFVVREGARLAARSGQSTLDQKSLQKAIESAPDRGPPPPRKIGFV